MEIDGLDSVKNQKSRRGDISGIFEMCNDNKTKDEQYSSSSFETKKGSGWRKCAESEVL